MSKLRSFEPAFKEQGVSLALQFLQGTLVVKQCTGVLNCNCGHIRSARRVLKIGAYLYRVPRVDRWLGKVYSIVPDLADLRLLQRFTLESEAIAYLATTIVPLRL